MNNEPMPAKVRLTEGLGPNAQMWTCFHCGEVCADAAAARLHFGASEHQQAGCQIDLAEYRRMEEVNRRHCDEDTELHRALHRMECNHQQALRREEEAGYDGGLRDGRACDEDLRAALAELLACHAEAEGWSASMLVDRAEFDAMLGRSQKRLGAAVFAAQVALGPNVRAEPETTA